MGYQVFPTPSTTLENTFTFLADGNPSVESTISSPNGFTQWIAAVSLPAGLYAASPTSSASAGVVLLGNTSLTPSTTAIVNAILSTPATTAGIQKGSRFSNTNLSLFNASTGRMLKYKAFPGTATNSLVVITGHQNQFNQTNPIAISTDGTSFTRSFMGYSTASYNYAYYIYNKDNQYYVWMSNSNIHSSTDLVNWNTRINAAHPGSFGDVIYDTSLNMFLGYGSNWQNHVKTSTDGINWTTRLTYGTGGTGYGIKRAGDYVFIFGNRNNDLPYLEVSTDGINWGTTSWSTDNMYWSTGKSPNFLDVGYNGTRYFTGNGNNNQRMYSTDGINWVQPNTYSASEPGRYQVMLYDGTYSYMLGILTTNTSTLVGTDGINWNQFSALTTGSANWPNNVLNAYYLPNMTTRKYLIAGVADVYRTDTNVSDSNSTRVFYSEKPGGREFSGDFQVIMNRYNITVDVR